MNKVHIHFENLAWETPKKGVKQKLFKNDQQQIRLVRFEEGFEEEDWCTQGHIGYVLDGKFTVDFNGAIQSFQKGDGLWIPSGEQYKHKAMIAPNSFVELVLFENTIA